MFRVQSAFFCSSPSSGALPPCVFGTFGTAWYAPSSAGVSQLAPSLPRVPRCCGRASEKGLQSPFSCRCREFPCLCGACSSPTFCSCSPCPCLRVLSQCSSSRKGCARALASAGSMGELVLFGVGYPMWVCGISLFSSVLPVSAPLRPCGHSYQNRGFEPTFGIASRPSLPRLVPQRPR